MRQRTSTAGTSAHQGGASPEAPLAVPKPDLELEATRIILNGARALNSILSGASGPSNFTSREHLLATVAVVALASTGGDLSRAAAAMGVLGNAVRGWVERAESITLIHGLKSLMTSPDAVKRLGLLPESGWPADLSVANWLELPIKFEGAALKPLPPSREVSKPPPPQPPAVSAKIPAPAAAKPSKPTPGPSPDTTSAPEMTDAVQWLRTMVAGAFKELKSFSELADSIDRHEATNVSLPSFIALKGAYFWQAFAAAKGSRAILLEMFPEDRTFVQDQLDVLGSLKKVKLEPPLYQKAFASPGAPSCQVHTSLPKVIRLSEVERRLEALRGAVSKPSG